ncbi:LRR receptor-like serine/threonine-protein kinase IOS1 [Humulus lupulus]|uniref:LRR receptor-like serine/threonine-protein kinase IOS1 n=1 Tax=Humulus lupulus TaxID=3486 RepID=UPI002B40FBA7|nr:LRR receptor-like serine/threonine-protein kinase IOS1 [Humulus lupulus]
MRVMKGYNYKTLFFFSLLNAFALVLVVHAQDGQSGFISLDCGLPLNSNYTESSTELKYISDVPFISTGSSHSIAPEYKAGRQEQVKILRSFPEGIRNCYRVNVTKGTRYLIRATFFHGNYDNQNTAPEFDLHIGANLWSTVTFVNVSISSLKEIIHLTSRDFVHVCLVNTGSGTPFISALEFRPLSSEIYNYTAPSESLALLYRLDIGSITDLAYRYPYDFYDRSWLPYNGKWWTLISTSKYAQSQRSYRPPAIVMSTAATPINESEPMIFSLNDLDEKANLYFYMYFTETQSLKANQSRSFNITINGEVWSEAVTPLYLNTTTIFSTVGQSGSPEYNFSLVKLQNSTLPPILNAFEVYSTIDVSQLETDQNDVNSINNVKSTYGIKRNWDGDPCAPVEYLWTGLNCSYNDFDPRSIISLNLSSSGLTGNVTTHISKLSRIQSLDLSNNSLTGPVPQFLTRLPNLRILNLERNNLTGSIPIELIKKSNSGLLSLSVGENPHLCDSSNCEKKKKKKSTAIPILASVFGGLVVTLLIAVAVFVGLKKIKKKTQEPNAQKDSFESSKRQFTYSEVLRITNNFERILGKGGFGTVYHGFIDENTQVAVKVLSSSSVQGYQQFQAEVQLLMKVYHRNLTSLVGYCNEGTELALIYEYMANGDLASHLSGHSNTNVLSWEGRIRIAIDAAQGLEYMHLGCKPPIIHRDVKTTNILLTEKFQAKLADFGLSRVFPTDTGTHVSTVVAGTPGYLDPAYHLTNMLNETSDIYSYGVVLLEIITNQPAIIKISGSDERIHISRWVSSTIDNGAITSIVDPRLEGGFDINSAWKAVEIGMACVSATPGKRPNMSEVISGLKECLATELARNNHAQVTDSSLDVLTHEFTPLAR